jgi:hypothetical protein
MKKKYIYFAIGAAFLFIWYKSKNKKPIDNTTLPKNNIDLSVDKNLPNSLDIVSNPLSGAVQIVPSPTTIMDYSKAIDLNNSNCCDCSNSINGYKAMPYIC